MMGCRVGMSTNPQERIQHWKDEEGHTWSTIIASNMTYDGALAREKLEAQKGGCYSSGGGPRNGRRNWSVYKVSGGKTPIG